MSARSDLPALTPLADVGYGHRVLAIRKQRCLTQQALADLAGLKVMRIRPVRGRELPASIEALNKIAVALGISVDELLFGEGERGPTRPSLRDRLPASTNLMRTRSR